MSSITKYVISFACLLSVGASTFANEAPPKSEIQLAFEAARQVAQEGPAEVKLSEQAKLKLPENFVYVPAKESAAIMRAWGNRPSPDLLGLIFPMGKDQWFVVIDFDKSGYVKDDDAKDWNADELLDSLKQGTEQQNAERRERGIPEMEIIGWVEKPHYDAATHRLVWSVSSKDKGAADTAEKGINYNTYALGREGYVSMNLVTDLSVIEQHRPIAKGLLANLEFNEGKRYADFDSSTDKVAAYGLTALVAGAAAKKLGLFAAAAVFLVKFWKLLAIAVVAVGGGAFKWWKRKQDKTPAA